nr:glycosyltransferase [Bacteroidota bacterium]
MKQTIDKNILLIAPQPFFQWRGTPIRVNVNLQALTKLEYSVDLLTLPIGEKLEPEGVNIIRVANPFRIKQIPIGPSLYKFFFDFFILFKGFQLIRIKKYLIVHGVEDAGTIAVILSRFSDSKAIFEKHSDPVSHRKGFIKNVLLGVYAYVEKLTVKYAQAVICTGPGLTKQVKQMGNSTPVFNISDIPSSHKQPSDDQVMKVRHELQLRKDEVLISFVGSFTPYQGIDLLMDTIHEVLKSSPIARFVLIGGKADEINKWKEVFRQQGILKAINFTGMVAPDEVPIILSASDILISPRTSGANTPLKLLDYLKAGRPIVATNAEANRLILNDDMAIITDPNPVSMASAIISLINDPGRRTAMGKKGKELYETKYNFRIFVEQLRECYQCVLNPEAMSDHYTRP